MKPMKTKKKMIKKEIKGIQAIKDAKEYER